jgi:hypothetical protein
MAELTPAEQACRLVMLEAALDRGIAPSCPDKAQLLVASRLVDALAR